MHQWDFRKKLAARISPSVRHQGEVHAREYVRTETIHTLLPRDRHPCSGSGRDRIINKESIHSPWALAIRPRMPPLWVNFTVPDPTFLSLSLYLYMLNHVVSFHDFKWIALSSSELQRARTATIALHFRAPLDRIKKKRKTKGRLEATEKMTPCHSISETFLSAVLSCTLLQFLSFCLSLSVCPNSRIRVYFTSSARSATQHRWEEQIHFWRWRREEDVARGETIALSRTQMPRSGYGGREGGTDPSVFGGFSQQHSRADCEVTKHATTLYLPQTRPIIVLTPSRPRDPVGRPPRLGGPPRLKPLARIGIRILSFGEKEPRGKPRKASGKKKARPKGRIEQRFLGEGGTVKHHIRQKRKHTHLGFIGAHVHIYIHYIVCVYTYITLPYMQARRE